MENNIEKRIPIGSMPLYYKHFNISLLPEQ